MHEIYDLSEKMIKLSKCNAFSQIFLFPTGVSCIVLSAGMKDFQRPPDFSGIELPEKPKLRPMEKVPFYPPGIRPPKCSKRLSDIRGPELVHNKLLYGQYGVVAMVGGYMKSGHIEMIRMIINRKMDLKTSFAEWRIDPPWKPITKKSQGKRMGGGKANIHHYVTPVKAGRVVFEVGGKVQYEEVYPLLNEVVRKMPFKSMAVSQKIMDEMTAEENRQTEENINPYNFKYIVENNMLASHHWVSPYDFMWHGKYR